MPVPKPKRNEGYTSYVARVFKHAKRNKTSIKGSHKGRGKNRTLIAPVVMKKIGVEWRKHSRSLKKKRK